MVSEITRFYCHEVVVISPLSGVTQVLLTESGKRDPSFIFMVIDILRVSLNVSKLFDILFWLVIAHPDPFQGCL